MVNPFMSSIYRRPQLASSMARQLEDAGALVIYVDLWSDVQASWMRMFNLR
jgi:hypothetical protein